MSEHCEKILDEDVKQIEMVLESVKTVLKEGEIQVVCNV